MDFWEALLGNLDVTLLILARMVGMFSFNPILARSNVPVIARIGISAMITAVIAMTVDISYVNLSGTTGEYVLAIVRELFVGFVFGFVCGLFIYTIQLAGDIMDSQSGLGMAKVFDPSTSIQMSIYGSVISFMLYLYFFASNAHLTLIRIVVDSYDVIPLGTGYVSGELGWAMTELFSEILVLVMQLAMPLIAAELIVEFCIGVMMKAVPQIQIMVVNIQLKVIFGFAVLYLIAPALSDFIYRFMDNMLNSCRDILPLIFE